MEVGRIAVFVPEDCESRVLARACHDPAEEACKRGTSGDAEVGSATTSGGVESARGEAGNGTASVHGEASGSAAQVGSANANASYAHWEAYARVIYAGAVGESGEAVIGILNVDGVAAVAEDVSE